MWESQAVARNTMSNPITMPMPITYLALAILFLILSRVSTEVDGQRNVLPLAVHLPFLNTEQLPNADGVVQALQVAEAGLDNLHPNYTFQVSYEPTNLTLFASARALYQSVSNGALGIVGDYLSPYTEAQALQAGLYGVYMCSGSTTAQSLSYSDYRLFYRTIANAEQHGHAIAKFVRGMGWSNVNLIFQSEYRSIADGFRRSATSFGISISTTQVLSEDVVGHDPAIESVLQTGTLIHVYLGLPLASVKFLQDAKKMGLMDAGTAWVTSDSFNTALEASNSTEWRAGVLDGFLVAAPLEDADNAQAKEFKKQWSFIYPDRPVPPYAMLFRDCLYSMSEGLIRLSEQHGYQAVMTKNYPLNLFELVRSFVGASGAFTLDNRGDRDQLFIIRNIRNGTMFDVAHVPQGPNMTTLTMLQPATFPGGLASLPSDQIARQQIQHSWKTVPGAILGAGTVFLMAAILLCNLYLFKHRRLGTVRHLSFPFLTVICLGCILTLLSTALSLDPTPTNCQVATWVFVWGIQLVLGAGMVKTYRIWSIFEAKNVAKISGIKNTLLFAILSSILAGQTIILIVFTALDPWMHHSITLGRTWVYTSCSIPLSSPLRIPFVATNVTYTGLLALTFLWLAFQTRNVAANYNESRFMYVTGQSVAMASIVVIVFALFTFGEVAPVAFLVKHSFMLATVSFVFCCLVGRLVPDVRAQARFPQAMAVGLSSTVVARAAGVGGVGKTDSMGGLQSMMLKNGAGVGQLITSTPKEASTSVLKGTFPVRSTGFLSRWKSTHIRVIASEGIISFLPAVTTPSASTGVTIDLAGALINPAVTVPPDLCCIQLFAGGQSWLIHFEAEADRLHWAQVIAGVASATSASVASAIGRFSHLGSKGRGVAVQPETPTSPKKQKQSLSEKRKDEETGSELKKTAFSGSSAMLLGLGEGGTSGRLSAGMSGLLDSATNREGRASASRTGEGKRMADPGPEEEFFH